MNIYAFLNSKDIRAHCEKIGHTFNALESAYLIYQSQNHTIGEKHAAWRELIETMPDMPMEARMATPGCDSLHDFLRRYMALEDRLVERFFRQEEDCVYRFAVVWWNDWRGQYEDHRTQGDYVYRSFADWLAAEKGHIADYAEDAGGLCCYVTKGTLYSTARQKPWALTLRVDKEGVPLAIEDCTYAQSRNDALTAPSPEGEFERFALLQEAFEQMWIAVPTPFQKGDILFVNDQKLGLAPKPFVLVSLCADQGTEQERKRVAQLLKHGDTSDMNGIGYWVTEEGAVDWDWMFQYLNWEYDREALRGSKRVLKLLQAFLRGQVDILTYTNAYLYLLLEERCGQQLARTETELLRSLGILEETER